MHDDALGAKARLECQVQLTAGGDVAPQALAREERQHRRARERLGCEHDLQICVTRVATGLHERPCTGAQVLLGDDVRGRSELARKLDRVAAAHLQTAALVEPAAQGERRGEARPGDHGR